MDKSANLLFRPYNPTVYLHVTKCSPKVSVMDEVFRALADPTRRSLRDELFREDGQTLSALQGRLPMTRFGVMKHLKQLEEAERWGSRWPGGGNPHIPNPIPNRVPHPTRGWEKT